MSGQPDRVVDDPEVVEQPDDEQRQAALVLRHPAVPVSIEQLAGLGVEHAIAIIRGRDQIIRTARRASLGQTSPADWVLFKRPDGVVTAYLGDVGCARVRPLWGIHVKPTSTPEKIPGSAPDDFAYFITGDGYSTLTGGTVEGIEGARTSKEDFCKGKSGVELDKDVRRAARANLNGSITRELAGLGAVPVEELIDAWTGTSKSIEHCAKGRGFGTRDQRMGADAPDAGITPPACNVCGKPMIFRQGQRGNFYSCADYKDHGNRHKTVDADKWIAQQRAAVGKNQPTVENKQPEPAPAQPPAGKVQPLDADEIFGPANGRRNREPGEEG